MGHVDDAEGVDETRISEFEISERHCRVGIDLTQSFDGATATWVSRQPRLAQSTGIYSRSTSGFSRRRALSRLIHAPGPDVLIGT